MLQTAPVNALAILFMICVVVCVPVWTVDVAHADSPEVAAPVDFARDIQPILANHCWSCHGPDEKSRQADLRLDLRADAVAMAAIVPGDIPQSLMLQRIAEEDDGLVMPPPDAKKPLSDIQKELLRRWIGEGAPYAQHWSFTPPTRPPLPVWEGMPESLSAIDRWVQHRLVREGLHPAPPADRGTLLRRVTLDLTGLPPSLEELDAFLNDPSPDAYEKVVDRLLASKAFAERMSAMWLDLARYADTNGYNNDEDRTMWPWRDWVIRAFDTNMPFDRFIVEQLAGDLLPEPTRDQLVATAFLRNQGHNTEGGIIQEEYRVEYVADRVHTAATVFLGLSMQCARCHDHKYDPISQSEYFQFYALFNNLDEKQASYSKFVAAEPFLRVPSAEQEMELARLDTELQELANGVAKREEQFEQTLKRWLSEHTPAELQSLIGNSERHHMALDRPNPELAASGTWTGLDSHHPESTATPTGSVDWTQGVVEEAILLDGESHLDLGDFGSLSETKPFSLSVWVHPTSDQSMAILSKMDDASAHRGFDLLLEGGKLVMHLVHRWPDNAIKVSSQQSLAGNAWHHVMVTYDGSKKASGVRVTVDGQHTGLDVHQDSLSDSIATTKPFHLGLRGSSLPFHGRIDELRIFDGVLLAENATQLFQHQPLTRITDWIQSPMVELSQDRQALAKSLVLNQLDDEYPRLQQQRHAKQKEREALQESLPAVMIMKDMEPPRETFVLQRGQYDQPADKVLPNVPSVLKGSATLVPKNRMQLSEWLVDPSHPLTARVAVNRFWELYFGTGIVKTVEDFGVTGEFPSHPELLDDLACEFIESGWDVKALQKKIVMSATYRQDSQLQPQHLASDPENRWLARGPRYRLPAETIRDNALAISGLLRPRVGGPSVKPYQPDGLWEDVTVERRGKYVADTGEGLHRRSMYTFWKRTCPPPSMVSFDAPNREVCVARRSRTNTPLQSLVLLNDPTYVEAARALAQQMLLQSELDDRERIHFGFRRAVARRARPDELGLVLGLLEEARRRFAESPGDAEALLQVGVHPLVPELDAIELAAWTVVASTLLNLDETISKR